jgi:hypothetical protein
MSGWMVVVTNSQQIDDIRKAKEDQISFLDAIVDVLNVPLLSWILLKVPPRSTDYTE